MTTKIEAWRSNDGRLWETELESTNVDLALKADKTLDELKHYGIDWDLTRLDGSADTVQRILKSYCELVNERDRLEKTEKRKASQPG